jgi:hypothetical protein
MGPIKGFGTKKVRMRLVEMYCESLIHVSSGFVNAQYRFVMNPAGDYTVHFADPDMYVCRVIFNTMTSYERVASSNGKTYCKSSFHAHPH